MGIYQLHHKFITGSSKTFVSCASTVCKMLMQFQLHKCKHNQNLAEATLMGLPCFGVPVSFRTAPSNDFTTVLVWLIYVVKQNTKSKHISNLLLGSDRGVSC